MHVRYAACALAGPNAAPTSLQLGGRVCDVWVVDYDSRLPPQQRTQRQAGNSQDQAPRLVCCCWDVCCVVRQGQEQQRDGWDSPTKGGIDELDSEQHAHVWPVLQANLDDDCHPNNEGHGVEGHPQAELLSGGGGGNT